MVQRLIVNVQNARSYMGLATHFGPGAAALAEVFAPGDVLEEPEELRNDLLICETCLEPVLALVQRASERKTDD